MKKGKTLLTAAIVVVIAAIYVVGFFLLWDYFNVSDRLTDMLDSDFFGGRPARVPAISSEVTFSGTVISEEEEKLISDYFRFYYAGLGTLTSADLSDWFAFQSEDELFDEFALDYEIELAGGKCFDSSQLGINIRRRDVSQKRKTTEIRLVLNAAYTLRGRETPCTTKGEAHTFIIDNSKKQPLIKSHTTDRAARLAAESALDTLLEENKFARSDLTYTYFPKYISAAFERLCSEISYTYKKRDSEIPIIYEKAEYDYDREAAVDAALRGFELRRTSTVYDENDVNFTSWCLFSAGIPMDAQGKGSEQWKWYSEDINHERSKTGCTESWYERDAFYEYVKQNDGFGLVAYEAADSDGEKGDIIQIMQNEKPALQCMITDIIMQDGVISDYIVCTDIYSQVPLRSIAGTDFRVLHIVGYNTANI